MRSELQEPANHLRQKTTRRERRAAGAKRLEPTAIDAAFADDSLPMLVEPKLRRDEAQHPLGSRGVDAYGNATLLQSLRVKLHALEEEHAQIRRLLDQAGHRRLDPAAR